MASTPTSKPRRTGDLEKEARVFMNSIAEADRKRSAYQDLVADGLMDREELRPKLDGPLTPEGGGKGGA